MKYFYLLLLASVLSNCIRNPAQSEIDKSSDWFLINNDLPFYWLYGPVKILSVIILTDTLNDSSQVYDTASFAILKFNENGFLIEESFGDTVIGSYKRVYEYRADGLISNKHYYYNNSENISEFIYYPLEKMQIENSYGSNNLSNQIGWKYFRYYDDNGNKIFEVDTFLLFSEPKHCTGFKWDDHNRIIETVNLRGDSSLISGHKYYYDSTGTMNRNETYDSNNVVLTGTKYRFLEIDYNGNWTKIVTYRFRIVNGIDSVVDSFAISRNINYH